VDTPTLVGTIFQEKYEVLSVAGSGGMGIVFHAKQLDLNRDVAIKLLHANLIHDPEIRARFEREAHALSNLNHKNIGRFYSYGLYQDLLPFIIMEYVEGSSLRGCLNQTDKLPWQRATAIIRQVADAMAYAHELGVIHRDLSPNNIVLLQEPSPDFVKVLDFGLAKIVAPESKDVQKLTQTGALMGSIHYICPELAAGHVPDQRSDIYSLSCIFYECIAGQVPHQADNPIGLMHKHMTEAVTPPSTLVQNLPVGLEEVILKGLAKSPELRYQSMRSFITDLDLVLGNKGTECLAWADASTTQVTPQSQSTNTNKILIGSCIAIGSLLLLAALCWFSPPGLKLLSDFLLLSKPDQFRISILNQIIQQEEALDAKPAAAQLRKAIYEKLLSKKGSPKTFSLALQYARDARRNQDSAGAAYWGWEAIRQLPNLDADDIERIANLQEVCDFLESVCSTKLISSGNKLLERVAMRTRPFLTDAQYLPLLKLHIKTLRRGAPSFELVKYLDSAAFIEAQNPLQTEQAIHDANEAVSVASKVKLFDYIEALGNKVTILTSLGKNAEAKSAMAKIRETFHKSPQLALVPRALTYYAKASIACGEDGELLRTKYLPAAIAGLEQQASDNDLVASARDILIFATELHDFDMVRKLMNTAMPILKKTQLTEEDNETWENVVNNYFELFRSEQRYAGLEELADNQILHNKEQNNARWTMHWTFRKADLFKNLGRTDEALKLEEEALRQFSNNKNCQNMIPDCYCSIAMTYDLLHDQKNASIAFAKSIETSATDSKKLQCLSFWLKQPASQRDLDFCKQVISKLQAEKLKPVELADYHTTKALLFQRSGNAAEAKQEFERAIKIAAHRKNYHFQYLSRYAEFCENQNDAPKAESLYREMIALRPDYKQENSLHLALALRMQQKYSEAEKILNEILPETKGVMRISVYTHLMWICEDKGDWKKANSIYNEAFKWAKNGELLGTNEFETLVGSYVNCQMTNNQWQKMTEAVIEERIQFWRTKGSVREKQVLGWQFYLGELLFNREELSQAFKIEEEAMKEHANLAKSEPEFYSSCWRRYGERLGWTKEWARVQAALDHSYKLSDSPASRIKCLSSLLHLAYNSEDKAKTDKYRAELSDLLQKHPKLLDGRLEALAALSASNVRTNPKEADKLKLQSISLQTNQNGRAQQIWELSGWRLNYDLDGSITAAKEAMSLASDGNERLLYECRKVMAEAYLRKGDRQHAKLEVQEMLNVISENTPQFLRALIFISATQMYIKMEEPAQAEIFLQKALNCKLDKEVQQPFKDILKETALFFEKKGYTKQAKDLRSNIASKV
jgi:serine/threonine protein kinase